jgi:hypothetical protein
MAVSHLRDKRGSMGASEGWWIENLGDFLNGTFDTEILGGTPRNAAIQLPGLWKAFIERLIVIHRNLMESGRAVSSIGSGR